MANLLSDPNIKVSTLPTFFSYKTAKDLVRVGRKNDGGYLVSKRDIEASDLLIGLGISDDWSFESDFVLRNKVPVLAYDGSIGGSIFLHQLIRNFYCGKRSDFLKSLKIYLSYKKFFTNDRRHIGKFVGIYYGYASMSEVLSNVESTNLFLKIDIEGGEYQLLDDLIQNQHRIHGLVIEFHDCNLHLQRIADFIEKFSLSIVHVHANNCAPLFQNSGLPLALEITFSKNAEQDSVCIQPHPLDMPNNPKKDEIVLDFT